MGDRSLRQLGTCGTIGTAQTLGEGDELCLTRRGGVDLLCGENGKAQVTKVHSTPVCDFISVWVANEASINTYKDGTPL